MSNQNGCQSSGVRGQQSTGALNQPTYTPFMMGPSFGPGLNRGTSAHTRLVSSTESVRDCMYWPLSLEASKNNGQSQVSSSWNGAGNGSGAAPFNFYTGQAPPATNRSQYSQQQRQQPQPQPPQMKVNYPQPTAYIQMQGQGGYGEMMRPLSIPCQMGPLGTNPASMIQPVEPLTIKVVAPPGGNPGGSFSPMTFQVGPQNLQN